MESKNGKDSVLLTRRADIVGFAKLVCSFRGRGRAGLGANGALGMGNGRAGTRDIYWSAEDRLGAASEPKFARN